MNKYYTIANLILLTAISYVMVSTVYNVSLSYIDLSDKAPLVAKGKIPHKKKKQKIKLAFYNSVIKKDFFKTAAVKSETSVKKSLDLDTMKQTSLNLRLWGTVTGSEKLSYAIIEDTKKKEQLLYRIGDSVNNSVLKAVLVDKVVLNVNGRDEILEMEKIGKGKGSSMNSGWKRSNYKTGSPSSTNISLTRSQINDSLKDINKLMKEIRIRPHFKNGKSDGLIVSGIKSNSIFKKMGLRNGDIILGVDGNKIESVEDAMKLNSTLSEASNVQLQIKRRGRLENIDFEIN